MAAANPPGPEDNDLRRRRLAGATAGPTSPATAPTSLIGVPRDVHPDGTPMTQDEIDTTGSSTSTAQRSRSSRPAR